MNKRQWEGKYYKKNKIVRKWKLWQKIKMSDSPGKLNVTSKVRNNRNFPVLSWPGRKTCHLKWSSFCLFLVLWLLSLVFQFPGVSNIVLRNGGHGKALCLLPRLDNRHLLFWNIYFMALLLLVRGWAKCSQILGILFKNEIKVNTNFTVAWIHYWKQRDSTDQKYIVKDDSRPCE